jgi:hypothetical protein
MKDKCLYSRTVGRIAFLLLTSLLLSAQSFAQQDLQIIVNGPWSYVVQGGRLWLVAPGKSVHHMVYIYSGLDVSAWKTITPEPKNTYTLNFDTGFQQGTPPNPFNPEQATICNAHGVSNVTSVLNNTGNTNYVASLPMPNAFSTYSDPNFQWDGYSESKVSDSAITQLTPPVPPALYTTVMVLHYWAQVLPDHLLLNNARISTVAQGTTPSGISIVTGDPNVGDDNPKCDDVSIESVAERNGVWTLNQSYALFPEETDLVGHQSHHYRYACASSDSSRHPTMTLGERRKFCIDHGGKFKHNLCIFSGGSADCHACQMSINEPALPGTTILSTVH